jgi:hypothetical protein
MISKRMEDIMGSGDKYHTFLTTPWYAMGQSDPAGCGMMVNETATRARTGLLNILSSTTIFILLAWPELDPVPYAGSFIIFEMVIASRFGLTPMSPAGLLGKIITIRMKPVWKPTKPKRLPGHLAHFWEYVV